MSRSAGAADSGTALLLDANATNLEYGLYAFDPPGSAPESLSVLLGVPSGAAAWIALADYARMSWEWHGPLTASTTLTIQEARYLSPGSLLYCAVLAPAGSSVTVNALSIRASNPSNIAPAADLRADAVGGDAPLSVNLDASYSTDIDGSIIEYAWDLEGDGGYDTYSDTSQFSHFFNSPGYFPVRVRVTDDQFASNAATIVINVNVTGNSLPQAEVMASPDSGDVPLLVQFDATGSADSDGSIVRYDWDFDGDLQWDMIDASALVSHTYLAPGISTAHLRVTDSAGAQDIAKANISVNVFGNNAPHAQLLASSQVAFVPASVDFDGSNSWDVEGALVYEWDLNGDGIWDISGPWSSISTIYSAVGSYNPILRVTDTAGAQDAASLEVQVGYPPLTLDNSGDTGYYTSLATVNGNPAISYRDDTLGDLRYVRATDADGTSWGTPLILDSTGNTGFFTSLAVVNGNPAISYSVQNSGDLLYVRAEDADGTTWGTPVTVDTDDYTGDFCSLAVVNGLPAISYEDWSDGDLRYVQATDADGTVWGTPVTVDSADHTGSWTSLKVITGNPAISYYDSTNRNLRYVRATDADGAVWGTPVTVDSAGDTDGRTSMAVVNGNPAICYRDDTLGDLRYVRATDADGTSWGTPLSLGSGSYHMSLAVVNGKPAISYHGDAYLRYIRATDADGTTWGTRLNLSLAGYSTCLAVVNGKPAISYFDEAESALNFVIAYNLAP